MSVLVQFYPDSSYLHRCTPGLIESRFPLRITTSYRMCRLALSRAVSRRPRARLGLIVYQPATHQGSCTWRLIAYRSKQSVRRAVARSWHRQIGAHNLQYGHVSGKWVPMQTQLNTSNASAHHVLHPWSCSSTIYDLARPRLNVK